MTISLESVMFDLMLISVFDLISSLEKNNNKAPLRITEK